MRGSGGEEILYAKQNTSITLNEEGDFQNIPNCSINLQPGTYKIEGAISGYKNETGSNQAVLKAGINNIQNQNSVEITPWLSKSVNTTGAWIGAIVTINNPTTLQLIGGIIHLSTPSTSYGMEVSNGWITATKLA